MTHAYLNHRNVLPLMGVLMDQADPTKPLIFTQWMQGTLASYIQTDQYLENFVPQCNTLVSLALCDERRCLCFTMSNSRHLKSPLG
jgi:hypothetical protein